MWVWRPEMVPAVLWRHLSCMWGKHSSMNTPIFLSSTYIARILPSCMCIRLSWVMARVESNPDRVECAGEPECDEVSWSVSLGCLAGSERNASPALKAVLLTSELSHLTLRTCLFTFHREKRLMQGGLVNLSWCNTCRTMADDNGPCSLSQNACVGFNWNQVWWMFGKFIF